MEWFTAAERFTTALASPEPTPGGGAAAAHAGAMGCALVMMAVSTTLKRKTTQESVKTKLEKSLKRLHALKTELASFVQKDGQAYAAYLTARKLPKEDPARPAALEQALVFAARVPADTAATSLQVLKELETIKDDIADIIVSDIHCGKYLLQTAIRCAIENVRANLVFIQNEDVKASFEKQISSWIHWC
ncbi:MAG: cyclodeaminase/cyclohydrolase family protein [Elusimicrobiaceae bacterium]|nr:cyclodeaminase/cyclohydrolase family protein [Elusimicrobiaceae bacterium]